MKVGEVDVPEPDDDPALLAALYSGFAYAEHWRKIVLSICHELVRASAALSKQKLTEKRLENLARQHPSYLQFLEIHLRGRVKWEREAQKQGIGR